MCGLEYRNIELRWVQMPRCGTRGEESVQRNERPKPKRDKDGAVTGKWVVLHPDSFECLKLFIGVVSHGNRQLDNLDVFLN